MVGTLVAALLVALCMTTLTEAEQKELKSVLEQSLDEEMQPYDTNKTPHQKLECDPQSEKVKACEGYVLHYCTAECKQRHEERLKKEQENIENGGYLKNHKVT